MEFWIIIFVVGAIIYFSNLKSKNTPQRTQNSDPSDWQEVPDKKKLLNLLNNISGFMANKIIESNAGFYVFGVDETSRKIAFVTTDLAITIIKYEDILSYSIRKIENKNYTQGAIAPETKIYLDIKRYHFNNPSVSIECFNAQKLMNRAVNPIKNQLMLKAVYADELTQAGLIGNILSDILNKSVQTPPPLPTEKTSSTSKTIILDSPTETKKEIKSATFNSTYEKTIPAKEKLKTKQLNEIESHSTNIPDIIASISTLKEEEIISATHIEEVVEDMKNSVNEVADPVENIDGKIKMSVSEIENLTKGNFLDNEVFSAMNDARVKGENFIYISEERLKELQPNEINNTSNNYTQNDMNYKPIDYHSEYKEESIEEEREM